ncbi:MAG: nucleotidyltransferase family protein [Pseudomonadota bacterium]
MRRLDPKQQTALCNIADPEYLSGATHFKVFDPAHFVELTDYHGITPIAARKLKGATAELSDQWRVMLQMLEERLRLVTIVTLALESEGAKVRAGFEAQAIPFCLVKGAAFASDMYPNVSDRPFSDLDFVLPADRLADAAHVMQALGYKSADETRSHRQERYREQKWVLPGVKYVLIELHTDLVHQPALRRRVAYGFDQIDVQTGGNHKAVEHLMTAIIHGSVGHKFHNLKLAVDVLQAMRHLSDDQVHEAIRRADGLNINYELASSAKLMGALFPGAVPEKNIRVLSSLTNVPTILSRNAVTNAHIRNNWPSRLRRHLFRWSQIAHSS